MANTLGSSETPKLQAYFCAGKVLVWDKFTALELRVRHRILASPVGTRPASNNSCDLNFPAVLMPEQALLVAEKSWLTIYRGPPSQSKLNSEVVDFNELESEIEMERSDDGVAQRAVFKDLYDCGYYVTSGALYGAHFVTYISDPEVCHSFAGVLVCSSGKSISPLHIIAFARVQTAAKKCGVIASIDTNCGSKCTINYLTLKFDSVGKRQDIFSLNESSLIV